MRRQLKDTMLDAALEYAARGFPVFPCRVRGKEPMTQNGHNDATTDQTSIRRWWGQWPNANIGFAVPDGFAVLDVDIKPDEGKHGDETLKALEAKYGPLPDTVRSLTGGGGVQHFFRTKATLTCKIGLFDSIDLKVKGGYVILPPSIHPNGRPYEFEVDHAPGEIDGADLPQWIVDARQSPAGTSLHTVGSAEGKIPQGRRNDTLHKLASSMRAKGFTEDAILAALLTDNQNRCAPPLDDAEVRKIAHSAGRYEQGQVQAQEEWKSPTPLTTDRVPPFPVECLPSPLQEFVCAVADSVQVSVDMAAVAALAVVALCIQKKYKVRGKPDWLEPVNLYTTVVASPAERKSAVTEIMTRPVFEFEQNVNDFLQGEIEEYEVKRNVLAKTVKSLEDSAAKPKKTGNVINITDVLEKRKELSEMEATEPKPLRLWTDDATMEALTSLLADNGGRMAVVSAEGGIFEMLNGRYTNGVNIDVFLKAHAGDSIRVDRKGRPSEYIKNPAMSVFLAIQPVVLDGLMTNDAFRGRGLTARFLYSIPTSRVGSRTFETTPIPDETSRAYGVLIRSLLSIKLPEKEMVLELSPEAYSLSVAFANGLEPRLVGDLEAVTDWAGKLHGAILRIAGVLHAIKHRHISEQALIDGETMQSAIRIGYYFLEHAKAAYMLMGADKQTVDARYILRALEKGQYFEIGRSELTRLCRGHFSQAEDMNPALNLLVEYGYVREVVIAYTGAGRPPAPKYIINPLAYGNNGKNGNNCPSE